MSVFFCYSHDDSDLVDRIARDLIDANTHVWLDKWELRPGDSLITRIQDAITEADCLCVVLSPASVESEWCRKELNAGLTRELDERRVIVIPILAITCNVPAFLREKMYADFRTDYSSGMTRLLEALAPVINENVGRIERPDYLTDFAWSCSEFDGNFSMEVEAVSFARDQAFSIHTNVRIIGNEIATRRWQLFKAKRLDWVFPQVPILMISDLKDYDGTKLHLDAGIPAHFDVRLIDSTNGLEFQVHVRSRWLGNDNGKQQLFPFWQIFSYILAVIRRDDRRLTPAERQAMAEILRTPVA